MQYIGRGLSMMSNYVNARDAALRIMLLNERISQIDPNDESGFILVRTNYSSY